MASVSPDLQWVWNQFIKIQTPQMVELASVGHGKWQGFVDEQQGKLDVFKFEEHPTLDIAITHPLISTGTVVRQQGGPMNNIMYEWCMKNVEDWKETLDYKTLLNSPQGKIGLFFLNDGKQMGWFIQKREYSLLNLVWKTVIVGGEQTSSWQTGPETKIVMHKGPYLETMLRGPPPHATKRKMWGSIIKLWQETPPVINWKEFPAGLLE
jgi:hypothetical protein